MSIYILYKINWIYKNVSDYKVSLEKAYQNCPGILDGTIPFPINLLPRNSSIITSLPPPSLNSNNNQKGRNDEKSNKSNDDSMDMGENKEQEEKNQTI